MTETKFGQNERIAAFCGAGCQFNPTYFFMAYVMNGFAFDEQTQSELAMYLLQNMGQETNNVCNVDANIRDVTPTVDTGQSHSQKSGNATMNCQKCIPLLGKSFGVGLKILLSSVGGIGKTLLTISLALRGLGKGYFNRVCFFALEDKDGRQRLRFDERLKNRNYRLVT